MSQGIPFHPVNEGIDAELVNHNRINVRSTQFFHAIGLGEVEDHEAVYVSGYNPAVGTTKEVVSPVSVAGLYPFITAAKTLTLVSDSANDTDSGTGTNTVDLIGLGDGYVLLEETVTLDGLTPVTTTGLFLRVNEMRANVSGTAQTNVGNIDLKDGATVLARIPESAGMGDGRAPVAVYTVLAGHQMLGCRVFGSTVGGNNAHLHTSFREFGKSWVTERHFTLKDTPFSADWTYGKLIPEKTDIILLAHSSGAGAEVDAGLCGFLRPTP